MNEPAPLDGESLLATLEEAGVDFVVIGGFAVSAHGHLRATKDLRLGGNFVLNTDHGRLDVLQFVAPELEYAELRSAAIEDFVFGHKVRFCGFDHLVAMKEAAGRPEDLIDLQRLREVRGE